MLLRLAQLCTVGAIVLPTGETALARHAPPCMLLFRSGLSACYSPASVGLAVARFGTTVIDPTSAVWKATNLALKQIIVSGTGKTTQIHYVFGRLPGNATEIPIPSPYYPQFLVVEEVAGDIVPRLPALPQARIDGRARLPWNLTEYAGRHKLSVLIDANVARASMLEVGKDLLLNDTKGK